MVRITERLQTPAKADTTLTLSFEQRQKSRQRVRLDSGEEAGLENAPPQASGVNSPPSEDPAVPAPEPSPAAVSAPPKSGPVTAKPSTGNEGRKRIRILNPGNTVILDGPDRRH